MSAPTPPPSGGTPDPYTTPDAGGPQEPYAPHAPYGQPAPPVPGTPYGTPAPGTPYDAHAPYGYAPPRRTDGVSVAALVTGILGMALIPLGLGIAGVVRTKDPARSGRGLAIAGIVLGALSTIAWALFFALVVFVATDDDFQDAFAEGYQDGIQEELSLGYGPGECFDVPDGSVDLADVTPADCEGPHSSEVIGTHDLEGDDGFPGADAIERSFTELCPRTFVVYVGSDYESSSLSMYYVAPDETTWALGDRELVCIVENGDGTPLTGSVTASRM
ncbi:septum formation family protein [Isoptericola sp. NPDC019693]|uniref:septum formation family protein n=1 Tax=Isoptericola sp. NPDC019693 TaxID=3364009 RepID=UPI00379819E9